MKTAQVNTANETENADDSVVPWRRIFVQHKETIKPEVSVARGTIKQYLGYLKNQMFTGWHGLMR